jgi:hypothetical protein
LLTFGFLIFLLVGTRFLSPRPWIDSDSAKRELRQLKKSYEPDLYELSKEIAKKHFDSYERMISAISLVLAIDSALLLTLLAIKAFA